MMDLLTFEETAEYLTPEYHKQDGARYLFLVIALIVFLSGALASVECEGDITPGLGADSAWTFNNANTGGGLSGDSCATTENVTLSVVGVTTGSACVFEECYDYDGTDDYLVNTTETAFHFTALDTFSINLHVNSTTTGVHQFLVNEGNQNSNPEWTSRLFTDDKARGQCIDPGADILTAAGTTDVADSTWYMTTYVYYGNTTGCMYVDGVKEGCGTQAALNGNLFDAVGGRFAIGAIWDNGAASYVFELTGQLDEVSIHTYALDQGGGNLTYITNLLTFNNVSGLVVPPTPPVWGLVNDTLSTPVFETADTDFEFALWVNTTNITSANASLWWDGARYYATSSTNNTIGTNNTFVWDYADFSVPIVTTNFTNVSTFWEYNLTWANATTTSANDTANTQAIYHGFYWGTYSATAEVVENQPIDFTAIPTEAAGTNHSAISSVLALFNNTNTSLTDAAGTWTGTTTAPDVTTDTAFVSNATMLLSFTGTPGASARESTSANFTITVRNPGFGACSGALNTTAINFTFFEEVDPTSANASDMDMSFSWWANADHSGLQYNGTANVTNSVNLTLCISPSFATYYVDSFQVYHDNGGTSRVRNYFLNNATVNNATTTINLYNIPTTDSNLLTLTIVDQLVEQPDVIVMMERYYPGEDLYRTVEVGLTDEDGVTFLYPVPNDVYYRFIVVRDYEIEYSGEPREIGIDTFTIDIGAALTLEYFDYQGISVSCNKTGNIVGCSLVNPTGLDVGAALFVKEIGIYTDTEICYTTAPSVSTTTLLCNVSGYSGIIQADLMFIAPESLLSAWTETFNGSGTNVFGDLGLLIGIFIIIGSALLLAYSPALSLVGAVLGLVISAVVGIVALSLTSVILIVVAAAFLIVKVKT